MARNYAGTDLGALYNLLGGPNANFMGGFISNAQADNDIARSQYERIARGDQDVERTKAEYSLAAALAPHPTSQGLTRAGRSITAPEAGGIVEALAAGLPDAQRAGTIKDAGAGAYSFAQAGAAPPDGTQYSLGGIPQSPLVQDTPLALQRAAMSGSGSGNSVGMMNALINQARLNNDITNQQAQREGEVQRYYDSEARKLELAASASLAMPQAEKARLRAQAAAMRAEGQRQVQELRTRRDAPQQNAPQSGGSPLGAVTTPTTQGSPLASVAKVADAANQAQTAAPPTTAQTPASPFGSREERLAKAQAIIARDPSKRGAVMQQLAKEGIVMP